MADKNSKKNKHLTFDDRLEIQECLNRGMTFKAIGKRIGKDQTTVSKEIKKHITIPTSNIKHLDKNNNEISKQCPALLRAPYVCNPCKKRHYKCSFQKQFYHAKTAQSEYTECLVESRTGIPLNKEKFWRIDKLITDGTNKGQHLYHIIQTHNLEVSKSTVYRHLGKGYLSVSKIDFPRVVKFKTRQKHSEYVPKSIKKGRTYADFTDFCDVNNVYAWWEMDTVIGRVGGKTICTINFTLCNFMIGLLLENKTANEVSEKIAFLKKTLNRHGISFGDIFPVIITDNGGEFSNVFAIENSLSGLKESNLFFCNPCTPSQKPRVEKNHTLLRDIVPKGTSFDNFTQQDVNLIFSHVNAVKRKLLHGKSPYDVFAFTFGENIANLLGVKFIPAEDVVQSPKLFK